MSTNTTNQTDADLIAEITERRRKADRARRYHRRSDHPGARRADR